MGMRLLGILLLFGLLFGCASAPSSNPPPTVLTITAGSTMLAPATVGDIYLHSFEAIGGTAPYIWSVTAGTLPKGMSLTTAGVLYGVPEASGTFDFTIQVVDSAASSATFQIKGNANEKAENDSVVWTSVFAAVAANQ